MRDGPNTWYWGLLGVGIPKDFNTPLPNAGLEGPREKCWRFVCVNITWADMLMYVDCVVFRGIIAKVFLPGLIVKFDVLLSFAVKKPEVLHLHCAGALAFDGNVDNANGGSVVYVNWRWWLWVSEFGKSETEDLGFLCIEKEGTQFGFGGRCGNKFEYCTHVLA